jgi:hypothetical protein
VFACLRVTCLPVRMLCAQKKWKNTTTKQSHYYYYYYYYCCCYYYYYCYFHHHRRQSSWHIPTYCSQHRVQEGGCIE